MRSKRAVRPAKARPDPNEREASSPCRHCRPGGIACSRHFAGKPSEFSAYVPSGHPCTRCGEQATTNNWPPNYGGGVSSLGQDGWSDYFSGSEKVLCWPCRIEWVVATTRRRSHNKPDEITVDVSEPEPILDNLDGTVMLAHDVRNEHYRNERGEYPCEVYG